MDQGLGLFYQRTEINFLVLWAYQSTPSIAMEDHSPMDLQKVCGNLNFSVDSDLQLKKPDWCKELRNHRTASGLQI